MSDTVKDYHDLQVWRKGIELAEHVYRLTGEPSFPKSEQYGLVSQMRRAAVSVPSNIAEGQGRRSAKDFVRFLYVARGSLAELDTQAVLAHSFGYLTDESHGEVARQIDELQRMLFALIRTLGDSK